MIEELLPYYEKQLQEFGQQSRDFANQYPKIAQRLSLNQEQIDDPHIERLIQAFSLIAARIDKKLHDSYDVFTRSIFEVMFPQYLKHFPSCSIVSFEDINKIKQLTDSHVIPKGTTLKSRSFKSVQCEFTTVNDVELLPITLQGVNFKANSNAHMHLNQNAALNFKFELFNQNYKELHSKKIPIYLDAISNFPLQVLDIIFKKDTSFSLKFGQKIIDIVNPFNVIGFDENQSMLPIDQHTHHAYRLLIEYFCFADKFSFLELNLNFLKKLPLDISFFELQIHFKLNLNDQALVHNYSELNIANFKLFTTPIVNLFTKQAEPQKINHKNLEYPLITDSHYPEFYHMYSILEMNMIREKSNLDEVHYPVLPFFAMSHYIHNSEQFYYSINSSLIKNKKHEFKYSIISKKLEPQHTKTDFLSIQLLCSNGNLAHEALNQTNNILNLNDSSLARRALILKRPSNPYYFEQNQKEQWRIISHLSLNNISLMKSEDIAHIKELLELYNLPKSKENQIIINSIKEVKYSTTQKLIDSKPFPLFVRGIKVILTIDAQVFRGQSLYIFSQLLSHVFNLKVQMNSYVDVYIIDSISQQELYQCVQNVGGKKLL